MKPKNSPKASQKAIDVLESLGRELPDLEQLRGNGKRDKDAPVIDEPVIDEPAPEEPVEEPIIDEDTFEFEEPEDDMADLDVIDIPLVTDPNEETPIMPEPEFDNPGTPIDPGFDFTDGVIG